MAFSDSFVLRVLTSAEMTDHAASGNATASASGDFNNTAGDRSPAVARVAVRIPPFWEKNPTAWFRQLESQFVLAGINQDSTKYHYVCANLENKYADAVVDIITNPPPTGMYDAIKSELIRRLSDSKEQNLRRLLEHEELGDRKPTAFLRHLQRLAGDTVTDEFLRTLWASRLPAGIQTILLSRQKDSLTELATLADTVMAVTPRSQVAAAFRQSDVDVRDEIVKLRQEIASLRFGQRDVRRRERSLSRRRFNSRSASRPRNSSAQTSPSDGGKDNGMCWYHRVFGESAKKCRDPCTYASGNA